MKTDNSSTARKTALKRLRSLTKQEDIILARIAQSMETAIIWATATTHDWPSPEKEALDMAAILKNDLKL